MRAVYIFDFGKVQRSTNGKISLNFVANEFSMSLIFPEELKSQNKDLSSNNEDDL